MLGKVLLRNRPRHAVPTNRKATLWEKIRSRRKVTSTPTCNNISSESLPGNAVSSAVGVLGLLIKEGAGREIYTGPCRQKGSLLLEKGAQQLWK